MFKLFVTSNRNSLCCLLVLFISGFAFSSGSIESTDRANTPNNPPPNPFLANSPWAIFHGNSAQTAYSPIDGPQASSRQLQQEEVVWKPIGPSNAYDIKYTGVYPDGGRASWIGGSDLIYKLDTESLDVISVYSLRAGPIKTQEQVDLEMDALDTLTQQAESDPEMIQVLAERVADVLSPILRSTGSGAIYNLLSNDNEYYTLTWEPDESRSYLSVYGDAIEGQRLSNIEFKRRWALPKTYSKAISLNMTYDGWVIIATIDGLVYAVSRDFTKYYELELPGKPPKSGKGWMDAFMRNAIAIDDKGGIYILTTKLFHKVQWTGERLSLAEQDGAWTVDYNPGRIGGGITPTLIGWGKTDKLVIITTGQEQKDEFQVYWREQIPPDWKGVKGQPKRFAGSAAIKFTNENSEGLIQEGSPIAKGFGFFVTDPRPAHNFPWQGSADRQIFATMAAQMLSKYSLDGASKYRWDSSSRKLLLDWSTDMNLYREICTVSKNNILYCLGRRKNMWTLEGIDWNTGQSRFHYIIGNSQRYNAGGGGLRLTPNGLIEYPSGLSWGITRLVLNTE